MAATVGTIPADAQLLAQITTMFNVIVPDQRRDCDRSGDKRRSTATATFVQHFSEKRGACRTIEHFQIVRG